LAPIHPPPFWSSYPVLQLVLEMIWSLVDFNRLCDPKERWRKMLSSLWSSIARILVTGKTELATVDDERFAVVTPTRLCVPKIGHGASVPGAGSLTGWAGGRTVSKQNLAV
jgi:hypothetical protein